MWALGAGGGVQTLARSLPSPRPWRGGQSRKPPGLKASLRLLAPGVECTLLFTAAAMPHRDGHWQAQLKRASLGAGGCAALPNVTRPIRNRASQSSASFPGPPPRVISGTISLRVAGTVARDGAGHCPWAAGLRLAAERPGACSAASGVLRQHLR